MNPIDLLIPLVSIPKMNRHLEWCFLFNVIDEIKDSTRVRPGPGDRIQERLIETSMGHLCTSASARIQKQAVESSRATQLTHFQHLQNDDEKVIEGE